LCDPDPDWEISGEVTEDYRRVKPSPLHPGEQFAYVFDPGDDWAHLCTAGARRIDPAEVPGILPDTPLPYWAGATFPTSTGAAGTTTTASHLRPGTRGSLISRRSGLTGGPTAAGRGEGSQRCSQAPAGQAITHLACPEPAPCCRGRPPRTPRSAPFGGDSVRQVQTDVHNGGSVCVIVLHLCHSA
jgi:hypothetical protein